MSRSDKIIPLDDSRRTTPLVENCANSDELADVLAMSEKTKPSDSHLDPRDKTIAILEAQLEKTEARAMVDIKDARDRADRLVEIAIRTGARPGSAVPVEWIRDLIKKAQAPSGATYVSLEELRLLIKRVE